MAQIVIANKKIGDKAPVYFIADMGANHDGQLERAKSLIRLAKEAGADAVKFQNFRAAKIVSDYGFSRLNAQLSHQAKWNKTVYEVYKDASLPWDWTPELKNFSTEQGIDYFSSPYDAEAVDMLDPYVPAFKIGSGDINWPEMLVKVAAKGKPVLLATGASDIADVQLAVSTIRKINNQLVLMQCNTNYTGSSENYKYQNLNVLRTFRVMYPDLVLGLSDHTPGHVAVLGAVALGARVIEKHFTDDNNRVGPDHPFALNPRAWREMVDRTRELELALGSTEKFVTDNEQETVIIQRRCIRAAKELKAGITLEREMIEMLRPAPKGSIPPSYADQVIGKKLSKNLKAGEFLTWSILA